ATGTSLDDLNEVVDDLLPKEKSRRKRRDADKGTFEPWNSVCVCEDGECEAEPRKVPTPEDGLCICAFDKLTLDAWPCHPRLIWQNTTCDYCDDHKFCHKRSKSGERQKAHCLCEQGESFCMKYDRVAKILNLWEFFGESAEYSGVITSEEIEALGFG
ncbi:unnamed protein product, partial [Nippostrongylus brasiliensis]|uniref:Pacifastin domain-containing protein n=1 Tax=Nippostrongylus brasiliensis TaxID=27835 RepID=A0A0N4XSL8_NIPBR